MPREGARREVALSSCRAVDKAMACACMVWVHGEGGEGGEVRRGRKNSLSPSLKHHT